MSTITSYFVCLNCIKRQSFIGWSVLDIEKRELGVDYNGAIKTRVFSQPFLLKTRCLSLEAIKRSKERQGSTLGVLFGDVSVS